MKTFDLKFDPTCSCALKYAETLNIDFAHGCNTKGAMASGVAASVRKNYPAIDNIDKQLSARGETNLGTFIRHINRASVLGDRSYIYNFYTQTYPGPGSLSYSAIHTCFEEYFKARLEERDHVKMVMPEIGCGRGGGSRLKVLYQIRKALEAVEVVEGKSINLTMLIWGDGFYRGWSELHHEVQMLLTSNVDSPIDEVLNELIERKGITVIGAGGSRLHVYRFLDALSRN